MLEKAALIYSERKQSVDDLNHGWESGRWKLFHVIEIFEIKIFMIHINMNIYLSKATELFTSK